MELIYFLIYISIMGAFYYVTLTRPKISYAMNKIYQFTANLSNLTIPLLNIL